MINWIVGIAAGLIVVLSVALKIKKNIEMSKKRKAGIDVPVSCGCGCCSGNCSNCGN